MASIGYQTLDRDEIDQIRPLWDGLRIFTREMTTHFKDYYEQLDFDRRIQKLFRPGTEARIDIAVDTTSGRIVGYAIATIDGERAGEVDSFFVIEEYRRMGIGRALLERSVGWLKASEPAAIKILTAFENRDALRLYEQLGFYPRLIELNDKR